MTDLTFGAVLQSDHRTSKLEAERRRHCDARSILALAVLRRAGAHRTHRLRQPQGGQARRRHRRVGPHDLTLARGRGGGTRGYGGGAPVGRRHRHIRDVALDRPAEALAMLHSLLLSSKVGHYGASRGAEYALLVTSLMVWDGVPGLPDAVAVHAAPDVICGAFISANYRDSGNPGGGPGTRPSGPGRGAVRQTFCCRRCRSRSNGMPAPCSSVTAGWMRCGPWRYS